MKRLFLLLLIASATILSSCKKDNDPKNDSPKEQQDPFPQPLLNETQIMMTLSSMAYVGINDPISIQDSLKLVLANPKYITKNEWELSWFSFNEKKSIFIYIVRHKFETNTYAIVSRGTDFSSINNILYDIDVFSLSSWPYGSNPDPNIKIARGALNVLQEVLNADGEAFFPDKEIISLRGYIEKVFRKKEVEEVNRLYITGHSLGGTISTVLSTYILDEVLKIDQNIDRSFYAGILTFASPGVGNQAYTDYFNNLVRSHQEESPGKTLIKYKRYYVKTDIIPVCLYADLPAFATIGYPLTPLFKFEIKALVDAVQLPLLAKGIKYTHPGSIAEGTAIPLDINNLPFPPPDLPEKVNTIGKYTEWAKYNHKHNYYSILVGGDPIP